MEDEASFASLQKLLPKPPPKVDTTEVDEVEYTEDANIEDVSITQRDAR
jgi:DnaJ family protein A protein 2